MTIIAGILLSGISFSSSEVEVISNSDDSYQVSGRFWLSNSEQSDGQVARKAATCVNCKWHLQQICADPINQLSSAGFNCSQPNSYACSGNAKRYQVWFLDAGLWRPSDWELRGTTCIGPTGPSAITNVENQILDTSIGYLPELKIQIQPETRSLVNLPTKIKVLSPNTFSFQTVVAGISVLVSATAIYRYEFANGNYVTSSAKQMNYVYRNRGIYPIKVTASWQATWQTALHGNNAVNGSNLTQTKISPVNVIAARGRLIRR